ncbi:mutS protein homolog 5-like [Sitodiplosis mosellana]|uniref:mutS protein homolog 5-like n=1 Tax=Sitodiplosis mosellana TaxID=263140 RepID=UPI002444BEF4|nr:mutS protein homolog 5-like [Sitodiplosis mosellana]XP_055326104.1 mutS protein homolog 5-like [Sitodiplosis mosellana]
MSVVSQQQQQQIEEELGTPIDQVIASFIWCDGHICVSYYNVSSLDLFITYEMVDLRPDFCHLQNLFRIMPNMRNVLASGPEIFLTAVMKLLGLPNKMDPNQYRLNRLKTLSAATFVVYASNEKTLAENRKRILEMHMPRMTNTMTVQQRFNFIETVVPLHQTLVVQSLGNLLHFLDANWKHLFLREETRPFVSDVKVYKLDGTVLLDESTFSALQVFAHKDHPSGFKRGASSAPTTDNGALSLYGVMNTCVSRLGSNQLKVWLFQPVSDVTELRRRHRMIEWCRNEKNAVNLTKFRASLKKIVNAGELYAKLIRTRGKPSIWKVFKRSLYYANDIADICKALLRSNTPDIVETVIEDYGKYVNENTEVYNMLKHVDTIIDLDESIATGNFTIRTGLDTDLDGKKALFLKARDELQALMGDDLKQFPSGIKEATCHFVAEMGFLIVFPSAGLVSPQMLESGHLKFIYKLQDSFYYTSSLCTEMNKKYGHLYVDIREREQEICDRLMEHVYERLYDIHRAINYCAQLDCLMAMASFSLTYDLVRPEMVTEQKILEIKDGRHLLVGLQRKCIPNNTSISIEKKNLINILIAPNASGKSVYMKAVAQIIYLAHVGSYVPASEAIMSTVDAIYTRMHGPESLYLSKSAYLVELQQMSNVIMNSSSKSLILVDELGQGTTEADGKSLLIACLRHLDRRGRACPVSFITTHYTDVYDFMVNGERVAMKTFEMTQAAHGGLLSTFKVIDGRCVARYAKDCAILRRFLNPMTVQSAAGSSVGNQTKKSDAVSSVGEMTIEEIESDVRNKKIACASTMIKAFINSSANRNEEVNYMKILDSFRL